MAMRGLVPGGLIRGWRAAVWIPKFIESVLISRCQCCGREGLACGGQLPLVDELACPSGLVVWLGFLGWICWRGCSGPSSLEQS